jgi:hypothetical protein
MTLTDHERPRTKPPVRRAEPPTARAAAAPLYVPPVPDRRPKLRALLTGLAALGLLGGVTLVPWRDLPGSGAEWRQALLDVGIPKQYRDLISNSGLNNAPVDPAATAADEDPELTALLGKAPPPPETMAAPPADSPPAAEAMPAPVPTPQPKAFTALVQPPAPAAAIKLAPAKTDPAMAVVIAEPPAPTAAGYRVQIAATGSDAEAKAAWRDVQRAFPEETADRVLSVQVAEVKGRTVRRAIVTGFPTKEAAKAFCATLADDGRGCIPRGKE